MLKSFEAEKFGRAEIVLHASPSFPTSELHNFRVHRRMEARQPITQKLSKEALA
jgi:hypothetical protein